MKRLFVAAIAATAALCGAPVFAAEMPTKATAYKTAAPNNPWTGCYVGVNAG